MTKRCVKYFNGAQKKAGKVAVKGDSFAMRQLRKEVSTFTYNIKYGATPLSISYSLLTYRPGKPLRPLGVAG